MALVCSKENAQYVNPFHIYISLSDESLLPSTPMHNPFSYNPTLINIMQGQQRKRKNLHTYFRYKNTHDTSEAKTS